MGRVAFHCESVAKWIFRVFENKLLVGHLPSPILVTQVYSLVVQELTHALKYAQLIILRIITVFSFWLIFDRFLIPLNRLL